MTAMLQLFLAASLMQAEPVPAVPDAPLVFAPVPAADAIAYFRRMCAQTMPDPGAFARALNDEPGWIEIEKQHRGGRVPGHFWRSGRGELAYLYLPGTPASGPSPACQYSFRTAPGFDHEESATALAAALGFGAGRAIGTAREPQTRWDGRTANGTNVRVVFSSNAAATVEELGGPAATLSISAVPDGGRSE